MNNITLDKDEIYEELIDKYSLDKIAIDNIINESITEAYNSDYPVIIEPDGAFAVFKDKKNSDELKYFKITYSKTKIKIIQEKILEKANKKFLLLQKQKVESFLLNKKSYLHAIHSHTNENKDYYYLFFDKHHKHIATNIFGITKHNPNKKKERLYLTPKTYYIEDNHLLIPEYKKIVTMKNLKGFTKDLSREIYDKIEKRIWIEILNFNIYREEVYIYIPFKTKQFIIEYIKKRFYDIFNLTAITSYYKR